MEQLPNGITLQLSNHAFPLSTDSIALSGFVRLPKNARVLDLGSGCGTLGLMLCASDPGCHVTGVELSAADHTAALKNAVQNGLSHRLTSICGDLRSVPSLFPAGSFCVCVSNPPYFTSGAAGEKHPQARHTHDSFLEHLFASAAWALQYGGDFFLVHKPQMLPRLCHEAISHHLEPKRLLLVRHKPDSPISLVLLSCRKGGKPGLITEEAVLKNPDGSPTDYYRKLYHL